MEKLPKYLSSFYQFDFHQPYKRIMRGKLQRRNLNTNQLDKLSEIYSFLDANGDGSLELVRNRISFGRLRSKGRPILTLRTVHFDLGLVILDLTLLFH